MFEVKKGSDNLRRIKLRVVLFLSLKGCFNENTPVVHNC